MHWGACFFSTDGVYVLYQDNNKSRIIEAKHLKRVSQYRDCYHYIAECDRKEFWLPDAEWSYWDNRLQRMKSAEGVSVEPAKVVQDLGTVSINLAGGAAVRWRPVGERREIYCSQFQNSITFLGEVERALRRQIEGLRVWVDDLDWRRFEHSTLKLVIERAPPDFHRDEAFLAEANQECTAWVGRQVELRNVAG